MKKRAESLRVGYQLDPNAHMGPLVNESQLSTVERYVRLGQEEGAELLTGGSRAEVAGITGGFYYKPTIFTKVKNNMRIAQEEIFGPVVCVIKYDSEEEAVSIANDSIYGLAGGIFSRSNERAERIAGQIKTGTMWINNYHAFGDFCPFGGYKQSGVGRELGHAGLAEYTQIKRVHVTASADHTSNFTMKVFSDDPRVPFIQYCTPTVVISGHGSLSSACREVVRLGTSRVLIITDPGVRKAGLTEKVQEILGKFCVGIFDQVAQDSDLDTVDEAVHVARKLSADCIVSVGGGSVIDTAKAVCVTLKNGGKADDHLALMRLTSTMSNPICDGHALQAIRLIHENLPKAIENGHNESARINLQLAATMAGWAFTIAQVGLAHAMAHTLGTLCNLPHGMACGIVLPAVMRFNIDHASDKLALAAQALGVNTSTMKKQDAAMAAADAVEALMKTAGHPMRLSEAGISEESLALACFHAIADTATLFNARPVNDPSEIDVLYKQVF